MQTAPFISIIVPVYNVEGKLERCIRSILSQTFSNFELVLIDDGSPDKSGEICDYWSTKDCRVKAHHQTNHGVSHARNTGIKLSTGKWITFVDSDDYIQENFLKNLVGNDSLMETDLVFTGINGIQEGDLQLINSWGFDERSIDLENTPNGINIMDDLGIYNFGFAVCHLYNSNIIKKNKLFFCQDLNLHEDHLFFFDYLKFVKKIYLRSQREYCYMHDFKPSLSRNTAKSYEELFLAHSLLTDSLKNCLANWNALHLFKSLRNINQFLLKIKLLSLKNSNFSHRNKSMQKTILESYNRMNVIRYYRPQSLGETIHFFALSFFPRKILNILYFISDRGRKNSLP